MAAPLVSFVISADTNPFKQGLAQAETAAKGTVSTIQTQFESLNGTFGALKTSFGAALAVLAGGGIAAELERIATRGEEIRKSAEIFNITTTSLQGLEVMAAKAGISSETLISATTRLEQRMRTAGQTGGLAAEKFNALGITTKELRDPAFTVEDAMTRLGAASNSTAALFAGLGRNGSVLIPLMRELAVNHHAAADAAAEVGALTTQEIGILAQYHGQIQIVKTEWENLAARVANPVLPTIGALAQQLFVLFGLVSQSDLDNLGDQVRTVAKEFLEWTVAVKDLYAHLTVLFQSVGKSIGAVGAIVVAVAHGEFAEAKAIWQARAEDQIAIDKTAADTIKANHEKLAAALKAIDESQLTGIYLPPKKDKGEVPDLSKDAADSQQQVIAALKASSALASEEARRALEESKSILKELVEDAQGAAKEQEEAQVGAIKRGIEAVHFAASEHRISWEQERDDTKALLAQEWADEQAYYAKLRALQVAAGETTKSVDVQLEAAHQKYLEELQKADEKYVKSVDSVWLSLTRTLQSSFDSSIVKMLEGTQTLQAGIRNLAASLINDLLNAIVKVGTDWVIQEGIKLAASRATAASTVAAQSGVAGASGTASFAGAPWPIDLGAPAFGAAMAGISAGYAVAERGWDVPAGVNPVAQLHAREMVLPADIAETVRSGGGTGGGGNTHFHLNVSALDAKSVQSMFQTPSGRKALAAGLTTAYRRGVKGRR